uniref:(northern house mosquito) hypothetical protein n=1 Tax=Culex pipiens TaxID=7175 RepID=A0A8D8K1X1_CULPI
MTRNHPKATTFPRSRNSCWKSRRNDWRKFSIRTPSGTATTRNHQHCSARSVCGNARRSRSRNFPPTRVGMGPASKIVGGSWSRCWEWCRLTGTFVEPAGAWSNWPWTSGRAA